MKSPQDWLVATALIDALRLPGVSTADVFAENGVTVTRAENLGTYGMQTLNAGLVITLDDGTEYIVTVTRIR